MTIDSYVNAREGGATVRLHLSEMERIMASPMVLEKAIQLAAEHIAALFLEQHQQDILARLDPQAIANLAVAASGAAVREVLAKKLPDVTHIVEKPTVYQRGVFGGLRRIR